METSKADPVEAARLHVREVVDIHDNVLHEFTAMKTDGVKS